MMKGADSSATTVHSSTQMMKAAVFSKMTVYSSTLTMQTADPSENMVQMYEAIRSHIAKHSNTYTVLPLFCVGVTKC
jgi:hypothetical protein